MTANQTVRVFIGSGEASLLERKVLIYSLHKHSKRPIEIYTFNGTHNSVERNQEEPFPAPLPLKIKYRNVTEFSYYRFLIPQLCEHQGKAIWLDSDIIVLQDIGELFDMPMDGYDLLMKPTAYPDLSPDLDPRCSAIMVMDCARVRFDLDSLIQEVDQGLYRDRDLMHMTTRFRSFHPFRIGDFDPNWNIRDYWNHETKLIHYTNLETQPWKYHNHPYGEVWFQYFREAIDAGYVTQQDIDLSRTRAYIRPDVMSGNFSPLQRKLHRAKSMFQKLTASF